MKKNYYKQHLKKAMRIPRMNFWKNLNQKKTEGLVKIESINEAIDLFNRIAIFK